MWFAYHMWVSVPAYSTVSCREKPAFSFASTKRRLFQVGASTSRSVPLMSFSERTIMMSPFGRSPGRSKRRGRRTCSDEDGVHGEREDVETLLELVRGGGERRQQLDDLALRSGRLHQQAPFERLGADGG